MIPIKRDRISKRMTHRLKKIKLNSIKWRSNLNKKKSIKTMFAILLRNMKKCLFNKIRINKFKHLQIMHWFQEIQSNNSVQVLLRKCLNYPNHNKNHNKINLVMTHLILVMNNKALKNRKKKIYLTIWWIIQRNVSKSKAYNHQNILKIIWDKKRLIHFIYLKNNSQKNHLNSFIKNM